jgi:Transposase IS66 family
MRPIDSRASNAVRREMTGCSVRASSSILPQDVDAASTDPGAGRGANRQAQGSYRSPGRDRAAPSDRTELQRQQVGRRAERLNEGRLELGLEDVGSEIGRAELDTNTVERAIRPIALGHKNHLCAGSDGGADRWAIRVLACHHRQAQ